MKYSHTWLQSHIEQKLPDSKELSEKIIFNAFEVENVEEINGDAVYDIKVLPDRAGDCLSHLGMAREIAGILDLTIINKQKEISLDSAKKIEANIDTDLCRFYSLTKIENISPITNNIIQTLLKNIGTNPISPLVDIGNFIMFDQGQPVHIFDADTIVGTVSVRNSVEGETFVTLQDEEVKIPVNSIVITDQEGIIALAGVKGGKRTMVTSTTKNILVEIANFNPAAVRVTARRTGVLTDASKRFENNFPELVTYNNYKKYLEFIYSNTGGTITESFVSNFAIPGTREVSFTTNDIVNKLGAYLTADEIGAILKQRGFSFVCSENNFAITIPDFRNDLATIADFAEEIGKTYGYDRITPQRFVLDTPIHDDETYTKIQNIKEYLTNQGFIEVQTYTFTKKGDVEVAYGTKDKSALRNNLTNGLKDALDLNTKNMAVLGVDNLKLFEIGTVFLSDKEEIHVGIVEKNKITEQTLDQYYCSVPEDIFSGPRVSSPDLENISSGTSLTELEMYSSISSAHKFKNWSVYPSMVRDLAVWTKEEDLKTLKDIVNNFSNQHCVVPARMFDTFQKDGRMSVAYRFVFQSYDKTLTDIDVETWWAILVQEITQTGLFEIR